MRIDGPGRTGKLNQSGAARRGDSKGGTFKVDLTEEAVSTGSAGAADPVTGIDAILALQSVEDPLFAKKKLIKRGQSMLDVLESLKADLLTGTINGAQLGRLVSLVQQVRGKSDPELDAVIDDIELRARVELAKLGHFPSM